MTTIDVIAQSSDLIASGDAVDYPKAQGYGALVDDLWVRLAPDKAQPVRFYTRDSLAQRSDDSGLTYNNVLDIGYMWSRADISGGEGLDYDPRLIALAEREASADLTRFWQSNNVDIRRPQSGLPYTFSLSHSQAIWRTEATLVDLATSDDFLHVAYGNTVERWVTWDSGTPAFTDTTSSDIAKIVASPDGDVVALLEDGTIEYFTLATGVYTPVAGLINAADTWFVKGRFIALIDNLNDTHSLLEYTDNILGTPFDTFRGVCYSMVSSGPAIVGAIDDGTLRSYVAEQANQTNIDSINLVVRGRTEVPQGEIPYLLGSNAGVLLVLTRTTKDAAQNNVRLYQAEVLDARFDYTVGQLRLRREWGNTSELIDIRQNMPTTRDEIWMTIQEESTVDAVWRFDLVTLGLSRHRSWPQSNTHSVVIFDEETGLISGDDVWKSSDDFMDEGWVIGPNINFGLNTDISWLAATLVASNLTSTGKQVELWRTSDPEAITDPDHPSWIETIRISTPGQGDAEAILSKVKSKSLALMVRIYSSEGQQRTPLVSRFAIRGIPIQRDWILELPVNVSDWISAPGRSPIRIPSYGDQLHTKLLSKSGDNVEIIVLDPPFGFRGIIDNIVEPTEYITDRGSVEIRCILQCRGSRITSTATAIGDAGLGLGLLGVSTLGIGQTIRT